MEGTGPPEDLRQTFTSPSSGRLARETCRRAPTTSHPLGLGHRAPGAAGDVEWPLSVTDEQELYVNKTELRDAIASHAELSNAQADTDLATLVRSAALPGLKARIARYLGA